MRLFNIVSPQYRELEERQRQFELFSRGIISILRNRKSSHSSCCTPVDIKKLFNNDACDDHDHDDDDDDDDDYSRFFEGLDLEVAS